MKSICVYLGAQSGANKIFSEAAIRLGREIANLGFTLNYGGSSLGLMGLLAMSVKQHGGKAVGIITSQLITREKPLDTLDELVIVDSMQERKHLLQQRSNMFVVMPGGVGTLEEAFETWNAIRIGLFDKPIGFLNIAGYFDELFSFVTNCEKNGFISTSHRQIPIIHADVKLLLQDMARSLSSQS